MAVREVSPQTGSVQCSYEKGIWSVWDTAGGRWSATSIPCLRQILGTWDHLTVNTAISNGKAVFISLTFDGVTHPINKSFYPIATASSYSYGVHLTNYKRGGWCPESVLP